MTNIDGPEQEFTGQTGPQVEGEPFQIGATIVRVRASENSALTRTNNPLNDNNWTVWRKQFTLMLKICGVDEYVQGLVSRPNPNVDSQGAKHGPSTIPMQRC